MRLIGRLGSLALDRFPLKSLDFFLASLQMRKNNEVTKHPKNNVRSLDNLNAHKWTIILSDNFEVIDIYMSGQ